MMVLQEIITVSVFFQCSAGYYYNNGESGKQFYFLHHFGTEGLASNLVYSLVLLLVYFKEIKFQILAVLFLAIFAFASTWGAPSPMPLPGPAPVPAPGPSPQYLAYSAYTYPYAGYAGYAYPYGYAYYG